MRMSSLEFKKLCVAFAADLQEVDEDLDAAVHSYPSESEVVSAIAAGQEKLKDYDALLKQLDELKKSQVMERYGEVMDSIRNTLKELKKING